MSAIAAISTNGEIISEVQEESFDGQAIVHFLRKLLHSFHKQIHLIWDGAKIHASEAVKTFLATEPDAKRLFLYRIPSYSPELNPTEQLWNNLKNVKMRNLFSKNRQELKENLNEAFAKIKETKDTIQGFFRHPKIVFGF